LKPIPPRTLGIRHAVTEAFPPTARLQNQPPMLFSEPLQSFDVSKAVSFNIRIFLLHNPCLYNLCSFYALLPWTPRVCRVSTLRFRKYIYLHYSCAIHCEPHYLLLIGMRGSVLQQNFHGASNMPFEELCLVGVICLFSLLFHHSLVFSPRPPLSHYFSCETWNTSFCIWAFVWCGVVLTGCDLHVSTCFGFGSCSSRWPICVWEKVSGGGRYLDSAIPF
jgi:hypothetical protein